MSSSMTLRDWFQYSDRDKPPYNPTIGTNITIDRFWRNEVSESNSLDWRREEWLIHSALIPIDQLNKAAIEIKSPHDLTFRTGWNFKDEFDFGNYAQYGEIELYSLSLLKRHPISQVHTIELSYEFTTYHALVKKNENQFYHPIDNILAAETNLDFHQTYDPTGRVTIHRDYLRDFLAATGMGLIVSVIANRFANANTEEELELPQIEDGQVDELTWISPSLNTPEFTRNGYFRGYSIIGRNFIVKPYDRPNFERSPWTYFGEVPISESELPRFIINSEGSKQTLTEFNQIGYLYFRPEVLQKYLQTNGYKVFFHMRNWGIASPPTRKSIDIGINSQGLVNAFAPDLAKLNLAEQAYWASFSSLPSGGICEELFETRMQNNPPHSPGVTELIQNARSQLNTVFQQKFSVDIFTDGEPSDQDQSKLSIGPINSQYSEVFELAKILYGWVIERMQIVSLRSALGGTVDNNLRQIKLLEKILMAKGLDNDQARLMTDPLVGLNKLRIGSAHIGNPALESTFKMMGASAIPQTPRESWNLCVDSVTVCLNSIASALQV